MRHSVAHTRGKTLIPKPKETKVYCGKDTSCKKLKDAMREGVEIARRQIRNHTQMDSFQCRDSDSSDDESSDEGSDSDEVDDCGFDSGFDIQIHSLDSSDFVSKQGNIYHLSSAKEKFLNDGKSRMSGQGRKKGLLELTFPNCQRDLLVQCSRR